jgi:hypothetical protein
LKHDDADVHHRTVAVHEATACTLYCLAQKGRH